MTHHHIYNVAASARALDVLINMDPENTDPADEAEFADYAERAADPDWNPLTDGPGLCNGRCVAEYLTADDEVAAPAAQNEKGN